MSRPQTAPVGTTTPAAQPASVGTTPAATPAAAGPYASRVLLAVTVLVVAANLRPTLTAVGAVASLIREDTGLGAGGIGLLAAVPLLAFAVVSPLVHLLSHRVGPDRAIALALVVLTVGTLVRSTPGWSANLWIGTALLGGAIAVGNVLVPAIIKNDFPDSIPVMTGCYTAVLTGFAALASGLALPLGRWGGWRTAVGVWALLSVVAAVVWSARLRRPSSHAVPDSSVPSGPDPSMWTSAVAWQVTLFMGTQSTTFYLLITWLPTIEASHGVSPVTAGLHSSLFQVVGIVSGLTITAFMRGRTDQRAVGVAVATGMILAMVGLLVAPSLVVLWVLLAGLSSGASLVVALTLVAQRARTTREAGRLSGMVQGVGYLISAAGPIGAGLLFDLTGTWSAPIVAVIGFASVQLTVAFFAGRDRFTHPEPALTA